MNNDVLIPIRIPAGWEIFNNRLYQIGNIDKFISENYNNENKSYIQKSDRQIYKFNAFSY